MTTQYIYKNSQLLHSLALALAGDRRHELTEESHYRAAIESLIDPKPKKGGLWGLVSEILAALKTTPNPEHRAHSLRNQIRLGHTQPYKQVYQSWSKKNFFSQWKLRLEALSQTELDPQVKADLAQLIAMLANNNRALQAALLNELAQLSMIDLGLDKDVSERQEPLPKVLANLTSTEQLILKWAQTPYTRASSLVVYALLPIFQEENPATDGESWELRNQDSPTEALTLELVEDLALLGLLGAAKPSHLVWRQLHSAHSVNYEYELHCLGFGPQEDDISAISFEERKQAWSQSKSEFKTERLNLAKQLGAFKTNCGSGTEWNDAWLIEQAKTGQLRTAIETFLTASQTKAILEFENPDKFTYFSGNIEKAQLLAGIEGLKVLLTYAEANPVARIRYVRAVAECYYTLAKDLYRLKER